jgi:hypothetical protein
MGRSKPENSLLQLQVEQLFYQSMQRMHRLWPEQLCFNLWLIVFSTCLLNFTIVTALVPSIISNYNPDMPLATSILCEIMCWASYKGTCVLAFIFAILAVPISCQVWFKRPPLYLNILLITTACELLLPYCSESNPATCQRS